MMDYEREYERLHEAKGGKYFDGSSLRPYVDTIAALVEGARPERILDYGSGKGYQYLAERLHERWGGPLPHCWDPGVRQLRTQPEIYSFDAIICTDVMEHIEEAHVDRTLDHVFSFLRKPPSQRRMFAFFAIACRPAKKKTLSDGRNVHLTVKPPEWWRVKLSAYSRPGLLISHAFDGDGQ
jgi:hypothetical protein